MTIYTNQKKIWNIVFVVCHPDDEAMWVGGLISELTSFDFLKIHVICLSGGNPNGERLSEFLKAKEISGYSGAFISPEPLREANNPLSNILQTVEMGIQNLGLAQHEIDILITHPPHGDEHGHPHHKQAYRDLYNWTRKTRIPFGYFSTTAIPYFTLKPIMKNMKRHGTLKVSKIATCSSNISILRKLFSKSVKDFRTPKYYIEFLSDQKKKEKMIECYNSIDLKAHEEGYVSYSQNSESVYIMDNNGMNIFQKVIDNMEVPGRKSLFP